MSDQPTSGNNPSIRILPPELQNQIAAGEVVERPASVLKELLENSLDAGAQRIQIVVDRGGQGLIQVQDDGVGITPDQLELAVTRHATSKILRSEDLFSLHSFGFRGEALPSIASVSRLRLTSLPHGAQTASFIDVDAGRIIDSGPAALPGGTRVEIRDLFVNVPARLKFLKTTATEGKRCLDICSRLALAHLGVHLTYTVGGRPALNLPATTDLRQRLAAIWPPALTENLLEVDLIRDGHRLHGVVGTPGAAQGQADRMLLYVNQRPVQDKLLLRAVRDAYQGRLLTREYPQAVLFLEIPPEEVDVNVHPAKSEVRFRDQQGIFSLVRAAVAQALERVEPRSFSLAPSPSGQQRGAAFPTQASGSVAGSPPEQHGSAAAAQDAPGASNAPALGYSNGSGTEDRPKFSTLREYQRLFSTDFQPPSELPGTAVTPRAHPEAEVPGFRSAAVDHDPASLASGEPYLAGIQYLGQVLDTYLVLATDEGLLLVDQHAAHERILFHRLRDSARPLPRDLLVPLEVPLHPVQQENLEQFWTTLRDVGFRLENPRPGLLIIHGLPEHLQTGAARDFLLELLNGQALNRNLSSAEAMQQSLARNLEAIWSLMACKSAITAGQELDRSEALHLLDAWQHCPDKNFCPHGRPITIRLGTNELEKMFKRKG